MWLEDRRTRKSLTQQQSEQLTPYVIVKRDGPEISQTDQKYCVGVQPF